MAKNDAISELTNELLAVVDKSKLSLDEKKKAVWRVETRILTLISGKEPRVKKEKAPEKAKKKKEKKAKK